MIGHDLHAFNDKIQFFRLFHEKLLQSFVYSVHQDLPSVLWAEDYMIAQIIYAVELDVYLFASVMIKAFNALANIKKYYIFAIYLIVNNLC